MSMNYKEVSRGLPEEEAVRYSTGTELVDNFVDSLQKHGNTYKLIKNILRDDFK